MAKNDSTLPLTWNALLDSLDLLARPTVEAARAGAVPSARVATVEDHLADTAAFCAAYGVEESLTANCVIVKGRGGGQDIHAAVLVLASDRADVNRAVKKHLGASRLSFARHEDTEELTGMTSGGVTPVGLPDGWPVLIDPAVAALDEVLIGGGVRTAKIIAAGRELAELPGAEVVPVAQ
ncbi:YbaK/EbsC family protein [Brachybacterium paraconglomeratum]|uniref:YbaK/EbsC family protein n=1 Tax=Brachybacterium paraconglomeratum TaxID=173362 RepID=UPI0037C85EED